MVKKSTYVVLAILVVVLLLLLAAPEQEMETVYLCTKMTYAYSHTNAKYPSNEWVRTFSYAPNGNILSVEETSGGETFEAFRFTYDYQNNVLSEIGYTAKGKESYRKTYTYELNETTLLTEVPRDGTDVGVDISGEAINSSYKMIYTHDSFGKLLSQKLYTNEVQPDEYIYTYDINGNILTETYQKGANIIYQYRYTYDIFGKCLTRTQYRDESEVSRQEFLYDIWGNQTTIKQYSGDRLWCQIENTYDFWGNLVDVHKVYYNKNNQDQTHITYEYDSVGNIIKAVCSSTSMNGSTVKEYTHIAVRVPAEQAKKIREIQEQLYIERR